MQLANSKKKVIFIGGTSYSGSTFFDMILANDRKGFSCGEVYALFYPFRPHHYNPACGCGAATCDIWREVLKSGVDNLYQSIFRMFPEVRFIIDSSKNPFWIKMQNRFLSAQNIAYRNILIWKTPLEFALSYQKRGLSHWDRDWVKEHRLFFSCLSQWTTIPYTQLSTSSETLQKVCNYLKIEYYDSKQNFWEKEHHTLFGNNSAKISLYEKSSSRYQRYQAELKPEKQPEGEGSQDARSYRKIAYQKTTSDELINEVAQKLRENRSLKRQFDFLSALTPLSDNPPVIASNIRYPSIIHMLKGLKQSVRIYQNGRRRRRHYGF